MNPRYYRRMHRATIKGDSGVGHSENHGVGAVILEMAV
jgi:hypothetical protein